MKLDCNGMMRLGWCAMVVLAYRLNGFMKLWSDNVGCMVAL